VVAVKQISENEYFSRPVMMVQIDNSLVIICVYISGDGNPGFSEMTGFAQVEV
jgi:hypothetical protein